MRLPIESLKPSCDAGTRLSRGRLSSCAGHRVDETRDVGATEGEIDIHYEGDVVGRYRLDLIVEGQVIVELKTVEDLAKAHYAQVRSYLRATGLSIALLANFSREKADYRRIERV
jgi:GxxExxY protein